MTCYRGFLLGSCRRVAGGRAALRGPGTGGPAARLRHLGHGQPRELAGCGRRADGGFRPSRVVVVAKTTRYEFEQQRYRYAELSEEDLKQLVGPRGRVAPPGWRGSAPAHSPARPRPLGETSGDALSPGSSLADPHSLWLVTSPFPSPVCQRREGRRSEGHLCLPVRYTHSFPEALKKFYRGEFRWLWRQRIRLYLEGTGINPIPVDLHEQQLSLNQHSRAFNIERVHEERSVASGPQLLPVRALNEVFIGESLSSRASYYEISVDDGPWEKQKSSGLNLCTGTGSKAWSFNINRVAAQAVEDVLNIAKRQGSLNLPLSRELVEKVTNEYNESLLYSPEEPKILFSIREPIANRVFSSSRQRCFSSKVCVRSRCWDACMVVDGGTSFEFNDGAIASMMIRKEDELRTVLLEQ
ncbi:PREDICTED: NAD kinase 2, mitochondrial [Chrysochloris asiatica]|uniref:NAD kinase 2, mitochondrial n=1 Tax=Chrysochloris asiatica TaxID=185453 RepID=A0A9B0U956_CHRAS|nr:PREDICTED: NAD kinase 2, mitochondrial [Chrysochloris asiatica]